MAAPQERNSPQGPVHVATQVIKRMDVPMYAYGLGTAQALVAAAVRSQVDGRIDAVHFTEGSTVAQGDPLATLDLRPFNIAIDQAKATLAKDLAQCRNAALNRDRNATLAGQSLVSKSAVSDAQALVNQSAAGVAADRAALAAAQLQLDYAHIVAPIAGRTGIRGIDPGNLVRAGDGNAVVVIAQTDPIAVIATLPEDTLQQLRAAMAQGPLVAQAVAKDGEHVEATGTVLLIDNTIDAASGSLRTKSLFANPNDVLWPGKFVRSRFLLQTLRNQVVVPEQCVQHGPDGDFVYLVDGGNHALVRPVRTSQTTQLGTPIVSGLTDGDRIVVEGQHRLHAGSLVAWDAAP